ncbi:MAG: sigma 54-interacting transcriptional regulator [Pyrinomonadaceae bacterium]|nr:sigma 54-interacting transcriptional regulator [Pyrinomonadaceae bacterium]
MKGEFAVPLFNRGIIGESSAMDALIRQIGTAARCDLTVLVSGESGTGKNLVGRAIHEQTARAAPLLVANDLNDFCYARVKRKQKSTTKFGI